MKLGNLILGCIALLMLIGGSCQKEQKYAFVPVDTLWSKHYDFKPGSYWIYRDSVTGEDDSFVVSKYYTDTVEGNHDQRYKYFYQRIYSTVDIYINGLLNDSTYYTLGLQFNELSLGYTIVRENAYGPSTLKQDIIHINSRSLKDEPTLVVDGILFVNLLSYYDTPRNYKFYIKNDVGFIKFKNIYHQGNLLRFQTIQ